MVCQVNSHSWCTLDPTIAAFGNPKFATQTLVKIAKVVERADNEHACGQRFSLLCQGTRPSAKPVQALTKGRIQPFNVGCIDNPFAALQVLEQLVNHNHCPLGNPAGRYTISGFVRRR